jgi:hypothetical protein
MKTKSNCSWRGSWLRRSAQWVTLSTRYVVCTRWCLSWFSHFAPQTLRARRRSPSRESVSLTPSRMLQIRRKYLMADFRCLVSTFPSLEDRKFVLPVFYSMWPRRRMPLLYDLLDSVWLQRAEKLDFSIRSVLVDVGLAFTFVFKFSRPAFKPKECDALSD